MRLANFCSGATAQITTSRKRGAGAIRRLLRLAAMAMLAAAGTAARGDGGVPQLALPLRCEPGRDCWIANYVDVDPGAGARDYACGRMTYNGHSGTDFAIRDLKAMTDGVPVVAAAEGVVRGVRDGEPDISIRERGRGALKGRECGNGVRIEHAGGWTTQYCHLRQGSVTVTPGEKVRAGTRLGLVGLSGETEFPHLHLTVRHGRQAVDPFLGLAPASGCGPGPLPLWNREVLAALRHTRGAIYNFGVAAEVPDAEGARRGDYRALRIRADAPRIALWAEVLGVMPSDTIRFELTAPDGSRVISQQSAVSRTQARIFRWATRTSRPQVAWPTGNYHGKISNFSPDAPPRILSAVDFVVEVH